MKNVLVVSLVLLMVFAVNGCKKDEPEAPDSPGEPIAKNTGKLVPLPLVLPAPMTVGTPENISGVENLVRPLGKPRPVPLAPEGVKNLAFGKPVTSSEMEPITGELEMIVDGDKNATDNSIVELGPFKQWVQIDLEAKYDIYAVALWHYHKAHRVYFDVVVQVSNDADFISDVTTIYNNDMDNSLGLGVGKNPHYVETAEGLLIETKGVKGQYVRFYSQANNQNDYTHYIEAEVFGK